MECDFMKFNVFILKRDQSQRSLSSLYFYTNIIEKKHDKLYCSLFTEKQFQFFLSCNIRTIHTTSKNYNAEI